jgi:hypothetical protein
VFISLILLQKPREVDRELPAASSSLDSVISERSLAETNLRRVTGDYHLAAPTVGRSTAEGSRREERSSTTRMQDTSDWARQRASDSLTEVTKFYLETKDPSEKTRLYSILRSRYARYTKKYRIAPDVEEWNSKELPPAKVGTSLEGYLDRQFLVYYDRDFAVPSWAAAAPAGIRSRLVVAEYPTGLF